MLKPRDRNYKMSDSLKDTSDRELLIEIQRRGYNLSGPLRDNETTAEIVKIGYAESNVFETRRPSQ